MITRHDVISISGYLKMKIAMEKRGRCQHFNFLQHMLKRMHMHMHHTNVFKKGFEAIATLVAKTSVLESQILTTEVGTFFNAH